VDREDILMAVVKGTQNELLMLQIGQRGCTYINDTNANTGNWFMIHCIQDTTFTTLTDAHRDGDSIPDTDTFAAGTVLYGQFTAITLNSGAVMAYKA
jgi:hypothetical protein